MTRLSDDQVIQELYDLAHVLGIKPKDARDAIDRAADQRVLLRRWKRNYRAEERRILIDVEKREATVRAVEAEERHVSVQENARQARERARKRLSIGKRLDIAVREAECISNINSCITGVERIVNGNGGGSVMHRADPLEDLAKHLFVIEARIKMIEGDLDYARGLGPPARITNLSGPEKDAMIISAAMRGKTPEEINEAYPALGQPLTIARIRKEHGLRSRDGSPNPKSIYAKAA